MADGSAGGGSGERRVRVRIEGRVQGVGFRYWVEQTAGGLGLRGWVRNRRDAAVEAVFAGPAHVVADMIDRCRRGPPAARVADVALLEEGTDDLPSRGFEVRPTI